jgi:uncharacterized membrane protein HdeD (DUF308 family)
MTDNAMRIMSVSDAVRSSWGWFLALGIVFIIGGLCAFLAPFVASLVVTGVVAAVLVIIGAFTVIQAWSVKSWSGFLLELVIGLVLLIGGIAIYVNPIAGAFALTLFVAASFLAKGIFQIMLGFRIRPHDAWGWMVAAGVVALLVGVMILSDFPVSGIYSLGLLAGISLIFTGWAYVALSLAARRLA